MRESTPKQNRYRAKRPPPGALLRGDLVLKGLCVVLLLLNLVLIYAIGFGAKGWQGYCLRRRQVDKMSRKVDRLEAQNQELFARIQKLKTDPRAQERLVRQQLGWVGNDEWVIEFPPPHPRHDR